MPISILSISKALQNKQELPLPKTKGLSKRRYFQTDSEAENIEMKSKASHFNILPNDIHHEITSYLPTTCTVKGLIRYSHISSGTRTAVKKLFTDGLVNNQQIQIDPIYSFVKKTKSRSLNLQTLFIKKDDVKYFYEDPTKLLHLLKITEFVVSQGYSACSDHRWCWIEMIEFFCKFIQSAPDNKEIAFRHHMANTSPMTQQLEINERHAFDLLLLLLEKSAEYAKEKITLIYQTTAIRAYNRELVRIMEAQDKFFNQKIVPLLH